jgi:Spy/CpxP family protein refolding chaperone
MKIKTIASIAAIFLLPLFAEIAVARGSRQFGRSTPSHLAGSLRPSGGFSGSFTGRGLHPTLGRHHFHGHHFGNHNFFRPHHRFGHHDIIIPRHGFHRGFFFGHRFIGVRPSSVVVWSYPGTISGHAVPIHEDIGERTAEKPLITIMLGHRDELGLSRQQVQDLETLRSGYERKTIRYQADIRIAEIDLQRLLKVDNVDLGQIKQKLQEIETLKTEMRLARIQAIEQGKSLLSSEQREKLSALVGEAQYSRVGDEDRTEPAAD